MKKKILKLCLLMVMSVSILSGCGSKEKEVQPETPKTSETEAKVSEDKPTTDIGYETIVVGLDNTFAPMGFVDENGELTGFDIDLAKAVSGILGVTFSLQPIDWSMKETELTNKNIDLIWNAYTITPEREEKVLFTKPYLENKQIVVTMADSNIKTLADLSGKTVAAQAESSAIAAIDSKPEIRDTFKQLATFETNNDCLMDLEAGRCDAVVADEVLIRYYISLKGAEKYTLLEEDFGDELYGIGARKEDTALIEAVNGAIETLKESGVAAEISTKWFGEDKLK